MTDLSETTLEAVSSVAQISADDWNACANPVCAGITTSSKLADDSLIDSKVPYNPFVSHAFFNALEASTRLKPLVD